MEEQEKQKEANCKNEREEACDEDDDSSSTDKDEEESEEKTGKGNAKLKVKNTKCSKGKAKKDGDRKRSSKRYFEVWKYFTFETKDGVTKAICCFCDQDLYAHSKKNGMSSLWNHVRRDLGAVKRTKERRVRVSSIKEEVERT